MKEMGNDVLHISELLNKKASIEEKVKELLKDVEAIDRTLSLFGKANTEEYIGIEKNERPIDMLKEENTKYNSSIPIPLEFRKGLTYKAKAIFGLSQCKNKTGDTDEICAILFSWEGFTTEDEKKAYKRQMAKELSALYTARKISANKENGKNIYFIKEEAGASS